MDLVEGLRAAGYALPGWRKCKDWRRQLKNLQRSTSQIVYRGGPNKAARVKPAVREYLAVGRSLSANVRLSLLELCALAVDTARWDRRAYFQMMLDKHLDRVPRRLLNEETLPAPEQGVSLFAPHPEWIQKGKQRPNVERGHRLRLATDQNQLLQAYAVLLKAAEVDQRIAVVDRLLGRHGATGLASVSFDQGFSRMGDRERLELSGPVGVMPKRGKKNAAETEHESGKQFVALRHQHSAVESERNRLEHHGLNRGLDVGLPGSLRSVGLGVLSDNLHVIGRELLTRQRAESARVCLAA